ncbi:hypothetical protein Vqi01_26570 [Micromonospora qiuiae]|uniref:Uncharacterized protein n=1 Tax=Micromonospora qiuiae TaxID=502268 RepID=A0ABQ4JBG4_9ACTN|nr:hypothetical protein [Micromonospora qiuiae]GIJ27495.1 hypothetical protein Vqi01_26570 [Micromonospora qiuiae]
MRQQEQQLNNDHPEAVRSAPVAVPPVDDHDAADDVDESTDRDRSEAGADGARPWDGRPGDDGERVEFNEPAPVPTTFGATTVGGAVAASAMASPRPEDERDPREEDTARPGDGAIDGEREGRRADPEAEFDRTHNLTDQDVNATSSVGGTREVNAQRSGHGPTGDPDRASGTGEAAEGTPARTAGAEAVEAAAAGGAGYGSAAPTMVDPDTRPPNDGGPGTGAATVPTGAATLFDESTAQGFRNRWRDVQLRFVDDPQAAAGEAQSLVDEAMQALSAALAEHKNKLGGWQEAGSTDTEQLRVAVREYRDFLDRVLGR